MGGKRKRAPRRKSTLIMCWEEPDGPSLQAIKEYREKTHASLRDAVKALGWPGPVSRVILPD